MNDVKIFHDLLGLPEFSRFNAYKRAFYHIGVWNKFWKEVVEEPVTHRGLDFGCGAGWSRYTAGVHGKHLDLVDIDTPEVRDVFGRYHKHLGIPEVSYWDGSNFPLESNSYDYIISKASLSKLVNSDWRTSIEELVRVSKPSAKWYIAPPYMLDRLNGKEKELSADPKHSNPHYLYTNQLLESKNISLKGWDWGWRAWENNDPHPYWLDSLCILCRGSSVCDIPTTLDCDLYGLVNLWEEELDNVKPLLDGRHIVHYLNREPSSVLKADQYTSLNIRHAQINNKEENQISASLKKLGLSTSLMPSSLDSHSEDGDGGFPSMGIHALCHAVHYYKPRKVYVGGIDFFESNYLGYHAIHRTKEPPPHLKAKGDRMKTFLSQFIENNPKTTFYFYTHSSFNPQLNNLHIL